MWTMLTEFPQTGLCIVWLNSNFAGHFKRATALGVVFSVGNSSGLVVGQIFTAPSAPRYLNGSRITTLKLDDGLRVTRTSGLIGDLKALLGADCIAS